jgi:hypothetical protein
MRYLNSYKFKNLFDQILNTDYQDLTDTIWEFVLDDGWVDDASRLGHGEKGYKKDDYEYIELDIPEPDEFGLATMDEETIEKYNEFDIELKDKLYDKGYLDLIDYDEGKIYIVKIK